MGGVNIKESYEKWMIWIVASAVFLSNIVWIMWLIHDKKLLYDVFNAAAYGLITGWILTVYFRKKDQKDKISRSLYGLQKYLLRIKIRLDDLVNAGESDDAHHANWAILLDKLRETLIDEPYEIFLNLDDSQIKSNTTRDARIRACQLIAEIESIVLDQDEWPSYEQMVQFRSQITQARFDILLSRGKYN